MAELNGDNGRRRFSLPSIIVAMTAIIGVVGSLAWYIALLQGELVENRTLIADQQKVLYGFMEEQRHWNTTEQEYDLEVRNRLTDVDKSRQQAFKELWEKLVELTERCTGKMLQK